MKSPSLYLQHLGIPALSVDQFGRISSWNRSAASFFRLSADEAVGSEWHSVVRTIKIEGCCAFCRTRHALRRGEEAFPVETTLDNAGRHQDVFLVPLPTDPDMAGDISFLVFDRSLATAWGPDTTVSSPVHPRVRHLEDDRIIDELTMRERDILACVVNGLDARGIAGELGISHATARNYVQRILTKLGVRNKAEAVSIALTYSLLAG